MLNHLNHIILINQFSLCPSLLSINLFFSPAVCSHSPLTSSCLQPHPSFTHYFAFSCPLVVWPPISHLLSSLLPLSSRWDEDHCISLPPRWSQWRPVALCPAPLLQQGKEPNQPTVRPLLSSCIKRFLSCVFQRTATVEGQEVQELYCGSEMYEKWFSMRLPMHSTLIADLGDYRHSAGLSSDIESDTSLLLCFWCQHWLIA